MPQSNAPSSALAAAAHLDDHSPPQASSPAGIDCCWRGHASINRRSLPSSILEKKSTAPPVHLHLSMSALPRAQCARMKRTKLFPSARACCCGGRRWMDRERERERERERSGNVRCNRQCRHGILPKAGSESGPRHEIPTATVLLVCAYRPHRFNSFSLVVSLG